MKDNKEKDISEKEVEKDLKTIEMEIKSKFPKEASKAQIKFLEDLINGKITPEMGIGELDYFFEEVIYSSIEQKRRKKRKEKISNYIKERIGDVLFWSIGIIFAIAIIYVIKYPIFSDISSLLIILSTVMMFSFAKAIDIYYERRKNNASNKKIILKTLAELKFIRKDFINLLKLFNPSKELKDTKLYPVKNFSDNIKDLIIKSNLDEEVYNFFLDIEYVIEIMNYNINNPKKDITFLKKKQLPIFRILLRIILFIDVMLEENFEDNLKNEKSMLIKKLIYINAKTNEGYLKYISHDKIIQELLNE